MLTAEQTHVAREAFEARRRKTTSELNKRVRCADPKATEWLSAFEDRLERGPDGEYLDVQRRIDWHVWREIWETALASVSAAPRRATGVN